MSDFSESEQIAERMKSASKRLHELAGPVGMARQVKEFSTDRRKMALSRWVTPLLKENESAVSAEHKARASGAYQTELEKLAKEYQDAETTLAQWSAEMCSYEAARSLLSFSKETIRQLE